MLSRELFNERKEEMSLLVSRERLCVKIAILLVGDDERSELYVALKRRDLSTIGIESLLLRFKSSKNALKEVREAIERLNSDESITGYIVQLPLPFPLSELSSSIKMRKDIDCFSSPLPVGFSVKHSKLYDLLYPCTAKAIFALMERYGVLRELAGKHVVIVGSGITAGAPTARLFLHTDATLTVCNAATKGLFEITRSADLLISAAGVPRLISGDRIKKGSVVINVGMSHENSGIVGDVDEDSVLKRSSLLAPTRGAIGLLTRLMVMKNTLLLRERRE